MSSGVLRSHWVRLSRPPATLAPERRRSYQIFIHIYLFATLAHLAFVPVLLAIDVMLLSVLNLACIVANLTAITLHRHGAHTLALVIKIGAISTLIVVAGMVLGGETGCEYYFFVILFEILISDLSRRHKLLCSALMISIILATVHVLFGTLGTWPFGELAREMLLSLNVIATFVLFTFIVLQVHAITEVTERRFRTDATHDSLTGVLNRRAIFERANAFWQQRASFALLLLDADYFKRINDNHGHSVGDEVLRHLAQLLGRALREGDFIGRVGGEEFLVLLPDTTWHEAVGIANRLQGELARQPCRLESLDLSVTLSIGLALSSEGEHLREVIDLADRRLYLAKSSGRNRLVAEGGDESEAFGGEGVSARLLSETPSADNA
ncbi:MAG: GGDEF domain-containing protein [Halomonas sp.]|nr:GGDEF domain-containing protein [Halomonas sp.]